MIMRQQQRCTCTLPGLLGLLMVLLCNLAYLHSTAQMDPTLTRPTVDTPFLRRTTSVGGGVPAPTSAPSVPPVPVVQSLLLSPVNPPPNPIPQNAAAATQTVALNVSACLLIKDDNDLLGEWLAYHYHTLDLRYLVVAVDPSSETSPVDLLHRWQRHTDLTVTVWNDTDFMPTDFLQTGYHVPLEDVSDAKSKFHVGDESPDQIRLDNFHIANHRHRQKSFVQECLTHVRKTGRSWTIHIDTDEFAVVNPWLRRQRLSGQSEATREAMEQHVPIGPVEEPSSTTKVLRHIQDHPVWRKDANFPCVSLPRLLFGSLEFDNSSSNHVLDHAVPDGWDTTRLETMRWQYHTAHDDKERNAQPKVLIDVSHVPVNNDMFHNPFSIHRPSRRLCRRLDEMKLLEVHRFPLSVYHYTGSWERYRGKQDVRRSDWAYQRKANVSAGWDDSLRPWLRGFVAVHGDVVAQELLQEYVVSDLL